MDRLCSSLAILSVHGVRYVLSFTSCASLPTSPPCNPHCYLATLQEQLAELHMGMRPTEKPKKTYAFWETQPVAQFDEHPSTSESEEVSTPFLVVMILLRSLNKECLLDRKAL